VVLTPDGVVLTPDGVVLTPDGVVLTPDGVVLTPDGVVVTPDVASVLLSPPLQAVSRNKQARRIHLGNPFRGRMIHLQGVKWTTVDPLTYVSTCDVHNPAVDTSRP
jgi:hypothetical protein